MISNPNPNLFVLSMSDDNKTFVIFPIIGFIYENDKLVVVDLSGNKRVDGWMLDNSTKHIIGLNERQQSRFSLEMFFSGITESQAQEIRSQLPPVF